MPTADQLNALAQQWGVSPLGVFAYAGANGNQPNSLNALTTFLSALSPVAQADAVPVEILEGYLQESRASASSIAGVSSVTIINWAKDRGYLDQNGGLLFIPIGGQGYPDGTNLGSLPQATQPSTGPNPAPSSGNGLPGPININVPALGGLQIKPIYVAGGVAAFLAYTYLSHRRR